MSSIPEAIFTPPSRSNSLRVGGGSRPRLKVQIPDEASDGGNTTGESAGKGVALISTKIPLRVEAAGAREKLVVEEPRRQGRHRVVNVHIIVVLVRNRPRKGVWWAAVPVVAAGLARGVGPRWEIHIFPRKSRARLWAGC